MATSAGIPVPQPIDMKGYLANNWEFFIESWTNYEIELHIRVRHENWKNYVGYNTSNNWERSAANISSLTNDRRRTKES